MRFLSGPTGEVSTPRTLFSEENIGISPWNFTVGSGLATGFANNSLGLSETESTTPDLALKPPTIEDPFMQAPTVEEMQTFRPTSPDETQQDWRMLSREEAKARGQTLVTDHEQFKKDFPRVPDEPGMTYERARAIQQQQDQQDVRDFYQRGRPVTAFISQMIGNMPAPENFVPFAGPVNYAAKGTRAARILYGAGKGAAEAVIGTTLFDLSTMHQRASLGQDTSWGAFVQDIAFSALIGSGFGGLGGALATSPASRATPAQNLLDTPENEAKSNVIMNDAIGSFLNHPDNAVTLSPSSYKFLQELTVPESNIQLNYELIRTDDVGNIQDFAEQNLLSDPEIASMLKGTHVSYGGGRPRVVYTGSMVPKERQFKADLDSMSTGIGPMDNYGSSIWFSTNIQHAEQFVDYLGTHPDVQNIDYPIDISKWRGREQGTRAVKINGEYFIGGVHAEALDKAVAYYGPDSQIIRDFENLPEEKILEAMGHLDHEGFTPGETAIADKEEALGYINDQREWLAKQGELSSKTEAGTYNYGIVPPRVEGALIDIKKPMEISAKDFADNRKRGDLVYEAMDAKGPDGKPLYDGVVARNVNINGQRGDAYATWTPDNILTLRETSIRKLKQDLEAKRTAFDTAAKSTTNATYSYNDNSVLRYNDPNYNNALTTNNVDMTTLSKMSDLYKFREQAAKASGFDLKTMSSEIDEEFKTKFKDREPPSAAKAELEETDTLIKKTNQMEEIMKFALGCKDG